MKKIDIHCHTTSRPVTDVVYPDASIGNIHKFMQNHEIEKTVLLATYFPHKGTGISNYRLWTWIDDFCTNNIVDNNNPFLMFGSLDFQYYFLQGYNELEELCSEKLLSGIKIYTCYQDINLDSKEFGRVMDLAAKRQLPVMFHAGYSYASMRKYGKMTIGPAYSAESLRKVAEKWPSVDLIFSHMSKPFFHEIMFAAQDFRNVYTDMSGLLDSKYDEREIPICVEEIKLFLRECGSKKILFGTDFPVQTHEHSIRMVEEAMKGMSDVDKANVYYNNAVDILSL